MEEKKDLKNLSTVLPLTDVVKFTDDIILNPGQHTVIFYDQDEQNNNSIYNMNTIIKVCELIKQEYPKEFSVFVCKLDKKNEKDDSLIDVMGIDYMPMMMNFRDGAFVKYKSRWFNEKEIRKYLGEPFNKVKKAKKKVVKNKEQLVEAVKKMVGSVKEKAKEKTKSGNKSKSKNKNQAKTAKTKKSTKTKAVKPKAKVAAGKKLKM